MDHKDMEVWKQSVQLVENIYKLTAPFTKEEQYGLTSQIRRSAISIPGNICEGAGRSSDKEFLYFLNISLGSLAELEKQLIISERLKICSNENIIKNINEVRLLIIGLRNYLKNKKP